MVRAAHVAAPMGPPSPPPSSPSSRGGSIVYATAEGSNVTDVDGNRYLDLAGGFGSLLLGHRHPGVLRALSLESERLLQALGDVYPSDAKVALMERLAALYPESGARVILGQSGADAVTAALKTAVLATGRPGVVAFRGSYHGLSYAPLAASEFRESYRAPFAPQLSPHVAFAPYPGGESAAATSLEHVRDVFRRMPCGAVLIEPILGRGGVVIAPDGFLPSLAALAREHGALLIADEIWTGLGRSGTLLAATEMGVVPDIVCFGKGLGGGLPMSACVGADAVMQSWRREAEVVHTSTFAGAPLACATAIATLDALSREALVDRSRRVGAHLKERIGAVVAGALGPESVRGRGLMIGIDWGARSGSASVAQQRLLELGYITSTGGTGRDVTVLTPALNIEESDLEGAVEAVEAVCADVAR